MIPVVLEIKAAAGDELETEVMPFPHPPRVGDCMDLKTIIEQSGTDFGNNYIYLGSAEYKVVSTEWTAKNNTLYLIVRCEPD